MKSNHRVVPHKAITRIDIFRANAFVAKGCTGNPAGVCLLPQKREIAYYQKVAIKMDMSETAFVYRDGDIYQLRWFTRDGSEVDLCGHATLAASYILWSKGYIDAPKPIYFNTRSGVLSARKDGAVITLDFPRDEVNEIKKKIPELTKALGVIPLFIGKTKFDYLVEVGGEAVVKNLAPDFKELKKLSPRGVIVTAKSNTKGYDFISRFFAPAVGIDEDPVTGSAHCALGDYWGGKQKKNELVGYQASREGGIVKVTVLPERVLVGGRAKEIKLSSELKKEILSY